MAYFFKYLVKGLFYIYMGGNRVAKWHYYSNILIVFLLSGLWHGANFTFVLWGLWYGIFICLESCYLKKFLQNKSCLAHFYTLFLIIFGWVMFRSVNVKYATKYWGAMLGKNGFDMIDFLCYSQNDVYLAIILGIIFSVDWRPLYKKLVIGNSYCSKRFLTYKMVGYGTAIILYVVCIASIFSSAYNPFIYFRF